MPRTADGAQTSWGCKQWLKTIWIKETKTNQTNGKTATPVSAAGWQNINSDSIQNINLCLVSKSELKQTGYSYWI